MVIDIDMDMNIDRDMDTDTDIVKLLNIYRGTMVSSEYIIQFREISISRNLTLLVRNLNFQEIFAKFRCPP